MEDIKITWKNLEYILYRYGEYLVGRIRDILRDDNSNASFNLSDTIGFSIGIEDGRYWVDVEMQDYWKYVDKGRPAGKQPPLEKIAEWIRVKPIQPQPYTYTPSVKSLAFLIQRSIKQKKGYAPPRTVLEGWIEKKGIQPTPRTITPSVESLAFLIARKIGREGTKGTHFLQKAIDETNSVFENKIDEAITDDMALWLETIIDDMADSINV